MAYRYGTDQNIQIHSMPWTGSQLGIFIGPEGGFEESEVEQATDGRCNTITLGKTYFTNRDSGLTALSVS